MYGQDPRHFWECTFREVQIIMEAASKRDLRQAWLHASYATFAYHDPKEMPSDPSQDDKTPTTKQAEIASDAESISARAIMKAWASRG